MRPDPRWFCLAFLVSLLILVVVGVSLFISSGHLQEPNVDLTSQAQVFEELPGSPMTPEQAWAYQGWLPASPDNLASPRRESTIWLRLSLRNSLSESWDRWLEVAPWRAGEVDLYKVNPVSGEALGHWHVGPSVPFGERSFHSRRNLLPLKFLPGEEQTFLVRVVSESRPNLALKLWELGAVLAQDNTEQILHTVLFGCVLTLTVLLLLRLDWSFAMLAVWLSSTYVLEAEKGGYLAFHLLTGLRTHGSSVGLAFWLVSVAAFLVAAQILLGLAKNKLPRALYLLGIISCVSLISIFPLIDANTARKLCMSVSVGVLLFWPLSLVKLNLRGDAFRQVLTALFVLSWAESLWLVVDYILNTGFFVEQFNTTAVLIRLGLIIGIAGLFGIQQQARRRQVEWELLEAERRQNSLLEDAVTRRTGELQAALVKARDANQAKVDFLGRVSHDLRSPLTSIIGYAQLIQIEGGSGTQKAGVILRSAGHMLTLVNDLIDHARGVTSETLDIAPVYVHGLLDGVAMDAKVLAQRNGNSLHLMLQEELPAVLFLDAKRLRQVLINLLDNAAKFTHQGRIELRVQAAKRIEGEKLIRLQFCVSDTGCGISIADMPNLFRPFFRSNEVDVEGAGLGLAIVEHWVGLMGGRVTVQSEPGEGTRVSFEVPFVVGTETDMSEPQLFDLGARPPMVDGSHHLIWLVEDNADIRDLLLGQLSRCHFDVEVAVDGQDCIERLLNEGARKPDLILTDYLMPRCDGAQVLTAVRERWPDLPVVLMSATQQTMQSLAPSLRLDFDACLMKPISLSDLFSTLMQLLQLSGSTEPVPYVVSDNANNLKGQLQLLDATGRQQLQELVAAGAITDIMEWSQVLPAPFHGLATHLRALAQSGDLNGLQDLMHELDA